MSTLWLGAFLGLALAIGMIALAAVTRLLPWHQLDSRPGGAERANYSAAKGWFWFGFFLLLLVTAWGLVRIHPEYDDFFVITAYLPLDLALVAVLIVTLGIVLHALRLRHELDRNRIDDLSGLGQHSLLFHDLQQAASVRLPNSELARLFVQQLADRFELDAAAVVLFGKGQSVVLAAQQGFGREEISAWEEHPEGQQLLRSNALRREIFHFLGLPGKADSSLRYLLIPMAAGAESLGSVILRPRDGKAIMPSTQQLLWSAVEWLGERIASSQRERELVTVKSTIERLSDQLRRDEKLFDRLIGTFNAHDSLNELCDSLRGTFGAEDVSLVRRVNGKLDFQGGGAKVQFSEAMLEAIGNGLGRHQPLVINQESGSDGETQLLWSNLLLPISSIHEECGLLFRTANGRITLTEREERIALRIAAVTQLHFEFNHLREGDQQRRKMLDRVISLLRDPDAQPSFEQDPGWFFRRLTPALPEATRWFVWAADSNTTATNWKLAAVSHGLLPNGLSLERSAEMYSMFAEPIFYLTAPQASRALLQCGANQADIETIILPDQRALHALIPFATGMGLISIPLMQANAATEYERMLLLASHLTRLLDRTLRTRAEKSITAAVIQEVQPIDATETEIVAASAPEEKAIVEDSSPDGDLVFGDHELSGTTADDQLTPLFERNRISGNLYMIGGRPRELMIDAQGSLPMTDASHFTSWFEQVLGRFSLSSAPDDYLVVELRSDKHGHLLLVHRVNRLRPAPLLRPPLDRLRDPRTIPLSSATDAYRRLALTAEARLWIDQSAASAAAIGFFFPAIHSGPEALQRPMRQLLAVDDSPVILDLITAMGQSLGLTTHRFESIQSVRKALPQLDPHVALIDLTLPDGSGLELARELHLERPKMPLVLICGWERTLTPAELQEAGIKRVLRKPFRLEQLGEIVSDFVGKETQSQR